MRAPTRRQLLASAAGLVAVGWVAGCSDDAVVARTPDERELDALAVIEQDLAVACRASAKRPGAPRELLLNAAEAHDEHAQALVARGAIVSAPTGSPSPSPSTSPSPLSTAAIAEQQTEAAARCADLAVGATPELARLLAAVGGSDSAWSRLIAGAR